MIHCMMTTILTATMICPFPADTHRLKDPGRLLKRGEEGRKGLQQRRRLLRQYIAITLRFAFEVGEVVPHRLHHVGVRDRIPPCHTRRCVSCVVAFAARHQFCGCRDRTVDGLLCGDAGWQETRALSPSSPLGLCGQHAITEVVSSVSHSAGMEKE
jgi:hypothetical protein